MICLLLHSKLKLTEDIHNLITLCEQLKIKVRYDDKTINKIVDKEKYFVIGFFLKFIGKNIDSLNLPISVAMAIYEFNKNK